MISQLKAVFCLLFCTGLQATPEVEEEINLALNVAKAMPDVWSRTHKIPGIKLIEILHWRNHSMIFTFFSFL